jgi:hypothetical protein
MWTDILPAIFFVVFGVYCCWYFLVAKTPQPLTLEEANLAWQLHKKQTGCYGSRIKDLLLNKGKIVGFRCECGYEFQQRRLLTQKIQKLNASVECSGSLSFDEIKKQSEVNAL